MKQPLIYSLLCSVCLILSSCSAYKNSIKDHRDSLISQYRNTPNGPLSKEDVEKLRFYPPNKAFHIQCEFEATPDTKPFEVPTYNGSYKPYRQYGWAKFEWNGKPLRLAVYQSMQTPSLPQYQDYLFLPFKDLTNDESTYGGGRYINLKLGDIQSNKIWIDFNLAYNPYCAYSDGYNCPIPPVENHLDVAIEAGELDFKR